MPQGVKNPLHDWRLIIRDKSLSYPTDRLSNGELGGGGLAVDFEDGDAVFLAEQFQGWGRGIPP